MDKYGIMIDFTDLDGSVSLPTPEEAMRETRCTISSVRAVFTINNKSLSASRRIVLKKLENFVSKNRRLNVNCPR